MAQTVIKKENENLNVAPTTAWQGLGPNVTSLQNPPLRSPGVEFQEADKTSSTSELFHRGQKMAASVAEKTSVYATEAKAQVTTLLKKYPLQSLLVGFGVGCALGAAGMRLIKKSTTVQNMG